jgi:hypothetical protein
MPYYVPPTLLKSAGGNKRLAEFRWPAGKQPVRLVPVAIQTELAVGACQDAHPDLVTRKSPAYRCRMRFSQDSAASHTIHAYGDPAQCDRYARHDPVLGTTQPGGTGTGPFRGIRGLASRGRAGRDRQTIALSTTAIFSRAAGTRHRCRNHGQRCRLPDVQYPAV